MSTVRLPCPRCNRGPRDDALSRKTDDRGTVSYCHRCGYTEANNHTTAPGTVPSTRSYRPWRGRAEYLWNSSEPLAASLAAIYLQHRGCRMPPEDADLRYLPARGDYPAAMLARVTDTLTGEPISLHFTRLTPDGYKVADQPKHLLKDHRKTGGCVRLWPDEAVTHGLAISEGIESALAAAHAFAPVWAAIDAGNLAAFPVLEGIEAITLIADHDDAGLKAASACAQRWADAGREARIAKPSTRGQDAADLEAA